MGFAPFGKDANNVPELAGNGQSTKLLGDFSLSRFVRRRYT